MGVGVGYQNGGRGVHRVSYPSGAWVDGQGRPCKSPNEHSPGVATPEPPPPKLPNPDPHNYEVLEATQVGDFLVVKVRYPDCTNYEGVKIMVYQGVTALDLWKQKFLDPHFFASGTAKSPIARFVPTDSGWIMALRFAGMMADS
jgi:hypothetical protein